MDSRRIAANGTLLIAAGALVAALVLAFRAWQQSSLPLALVSLLLLFGAPPFAVAAMLVRNARLEPKPPAPPASLVDALDRAERALRVVNVARAHACVFGANALVMGICQAGRLIDAPEFVLGHGVIVATALAVYLPWLRRRETCARDRCVEWRRRLREARPAIGY